MRTWVSQWRCAVAPGDWIERRGGIHSGTLCWTGLGKRGGGEGRNGSCPIARLRLLSGRLTRRGRWCFTFQRGSGDGGRDACWIRCRSWRRWGGRVRRLGTRLVCRPWALEPPLRHWFMRCTGFQLTLMLIVYLSLQPYKYKMKFLFMKHQVSVADQAVY